MTWIRLWTIVAISNLKCERNPRCCRIRHPEKSVFSCSDYVRPTENAENMSIIVKFFVK